MIDYKASGVIHSLIRTPRRVDGEVLFLLLVYQNNSVQPWCVATYVNGSKERNAGRYFSNFTKALEYFCEEGRSDWDEHLFLE